MPFRISEHDGRDAHEILISHFGYSICIRCSLFYLCRRIRRLLAVFLVGHLSCQFFFCLLVDDCSVPATSVIADRKTSLAEWEKAHPEVAQEPPVGEK